MTNLLIIVISFHKFLVQILNKNINIVNSVSATSEHEIINFVKHDKQLDNEINKPNEKTENENEKEHETGYDAEIHLNNKEKEIDDLIELDRSPQWKDNFNLPQSLKENYLHFPH